MDTIFLQAIAELLERGEMVEPIIDPTSPHSGFGNSPNYTREVRCWQTSTTDIRARILRNQVRKAWLDQAIGMALWCFRATSKLEDVQFYNPNARRFSDDGINIRAAWGVRLLGGGIDSAFNRALDILKRDPFSLRAVIPVYNTGDIGVASRDIPCLTGIHLLSRNGKLHMTCQLRALNPYWVWVYDHFFLTLLLEFGACLLGKEPGSLSYQVSSLLIDEQDTLLIKQALAQPSDPGVAMPPMPIETDWRVLDKVLLVESHLRPLLSADQPDEKELVSLVEEFSLPVWWSSLLLTLCGIYLIRHKKAHSETEVFIPDWAKGND